MGSKTWNGNAGTSDWTNAENWQENEVPQDGDDITIPSFDPHDVPSPQAPTFGAGKLDVQGGMLFGGPITVGDEFSWSGGQISAEIVVSSSGTVTVGDPRLALEGALTNNGTLTFTGSGDYAMFDGATITNEGTLTVSGEINFRHTAGASVALIQRGILEFGTLDPSEVAQVTFNGGVFSLQIESGTTTIDTTVEFAGGSYLELAGGDLSGAGNILITGGELDCQTVATVKKPLTLTMAGGLAQCGDVGQTAIRLTCQGTLQMQAGSLQGRIHLAGSGTAHWPAGNTSSMGPCCLVIENHLKVADGDAIAMSNTGEILVGGRLSFLGSASISGGTLTNVGLIVADADSATVTLDAQLMNTDTSAAREPGTGAWPFPKAAIKRGAIIIDKSHLNIATVLGEGTGLISGTLYVKRAGTAAAPTLDGSITTIAKNACLRAQGIVPVDITCDGRIEIAGDSVPSLHMSSLALSGTGRLELPASCWTGGTPTLILDGRLTAGGVAGGVLALPTPAFDKIKDLTLITFGDDIGYFGRIDMPSGSVLTQSYKDLQKYVVSTTVRTDVPGFDKLAFPDDVKFANPQPPAAGRGDWVMQELFENTEFAFAGFYLAPSHGHVDQSWMGKYDLLREQGWGIVPIYWGTATLPGGSPAGDPITEAQAKIDAQQAVKLAQQAKIPQGSSIFFDAELQGTPEQEAARTTYLNAWCDAINALGYHGQLYAQRQVALPFLAQRPGVLVWIPGGFGQPAGTLDEFGQVLEVVRSKFRAQQGPPPLDPPPDIWQWRIGYSPPQIGPILWTFLDSKGVSRQPGHKPDWDFDVAWTVDPSGTAAGVVKKYNIVQNIVPGQGDWKPGNQNITLTLSRVSARPNGTTVLISASSGEVQAPIQVTIPAGQTSMTVPVDVHPVDADTEVELSAWTPRQSLAAAATKTVTVTAAQ